MADAVIAELRALRLEEVEEDDSGAETGSNAGNLFARVPGPEGARTILLCAHMDTVPLAAPVEVVREEGIFRNRNEGILGADNKPQWPRSSRSSGTWSTRGRPWASSCCSPPARSRAPRGQGLRRRAASRRVRLRLRPRFANR